MAVNPVYVRLVNTVGSVVVFQQQIHLYRPSEALLEPIHDVSRREILSHKLFDRDFSSLYSLSSLDKFPCKVRPLVHVQD